MDTYIGTVLYFGVTRLRNVAYLCICLAPPTTQHYPATVASLLAMLAMATQIGAELAGRFVFQEFGNEMGENDSEALLFRISWFSTTVSWQL